MEQVYWLTNTFLDLILRDNVLPPTLNTSIILAAVDLGPQATLELVKVTMKIIIKTDNVNNECIFAYLPPLRAPPNI